MREKLISAKEVAAKIPCSVRTVRRWAASGEIPAVRIGGQWRFVWQAVLRDARIAKMEKH